MKRFLFSILLIFSLLSIAGCSPQTLSHEDENEPHESTNQQTDGYYDSIIFNYDKSFKYFNQFIKTIAEKHKIRYMEHSEHVSEVLIDMYNNLYSVEEINRKRKDAKILDFRRGSSNDKK